MPFLSLLFFLPTLLQWTRKVTQMDKALTLGEAGLQFIPAACQLRIVNQRRGLRKKLHLELHFLCRFQPCALIYYTVWKMYFKSHKPTTEYDLTWVSIRTVMNRNLQKVHNCKSYFASIFNRNVIFIMNGKGKISSWNYNKYLLVEEYGGVDQNSGRTSWWNNWGFTEYYWIC